MPSQARETGAVRVSVTQYQRALGTGPVVQDLLGPAGETSVSQHLGALLQDNPAERDEIPRDLVEKEAEASAGRRSSRKPSALGSNRPHRSTWLSSPRP